MRHVRSFAIAAAAASLAACSDGASTVVVPIYDVGPDMGIVANGGTHAALPLSGDEEVPARPTRARGAATFSLSADGTEMTYQLIVANIENVVQSHIHIAPAGTNGPVTVFLFGPVPAGGGRVDGVLAEGTITAANLIGPLAGQTLDALVERMTSGNAYVNVHTNDGVDLPNSGPGDFPGGEVRGQIR